MTHFSSYQVTGNQGVKVIDRLEVELGLGISFITATVRALCNHISGTIAINLEKMQPQWKLGIILLIPVHLLNTLSSLGFNLSGNLRKIQHGGSECRLFYQDNLGASLSSDTYQLYGLEFIHYLSEVLFPLLRNEESNNRSYSTRTFVTLKGAHFFIWEIC